MWHLHVSLVMVALWNHSGSIYSYHEIPSLNHRMYLVQIGRLIVTYFDIFITNLPYLFHLATLLQVWRCVCARPTDKFQLSVWQIEFNRWCGFLRFLEFRYFWSSSTFIFINYFYILPSMSPFLYSAYF